MAGERGGDHHRLSDRGQRQGSRAARRLRLCRQAGGPAGRDQCRRRRHDAKTVGLAAGAGGEGRREWRPRGLRNQGNLFKQQTQEQRKFEKEKAMNASRKVLVVDDDPAVRKSIDRVLTGKGYAVITAENGEEALRKLNEEKYDLVYTDIRMPGISGLEVAEQVKARKPWTPVVIITGYGTDAAEARAKAAGVSSFVHKPLSPAMIEDSARDALAAPTAQVLALPAAAEEAPLAEPAATGSALLNVLL